MSFRDLLYVASYMKTVKKQLKNKAKEEIFIRQFIEFVLQRMYNDKDIAWDADTITHFLMFRFQFFSSPTMFKEDFCREILHRAQSILDSFNLYQICKANFVVYILYPEFESPFRQKLLEKFASHKRFDYFQTYQTIWILRGLLYKRKNSIRDQNSLPVNFDLLKSDVIVKLKKQNYCDWQLTNVAKSFMNLKGPARQEIEAEIFRIVSEGIRFNPQALDAEASVLPCVHLMHTLSLLSVTPESKALIIESTRIIFTKFFISSSRKLEKSESSIQKTFIRAYMHLSRLFKLLHVSNLDFCLISMNNLLGNTHTKIFHSYILPYFSTLVYLNYPWRFSSEYLASGELLNSWRNLTSAIENFTANSEFYKSVDEEEDIDLLAVDRDEVYINYLWALCASDKYNKACVNILLMPYVINHEKVYTEELYLKLIQVYFWLKMEYSDEIQYTSEMLKNIMNFKLERDSTVFAKRECEVKRKVREVLGSANVKIVEEYSDFPFRFDFALPEEKKAAVVYREDFYVDADGVPMLDGIQTVMERQYKLLGWEVKKIHTSADIESLKDFFQTKQ